MDQDVGGGGGGGAPAQDTQPRGAQLQQIKGTHMGNNGVFSECRTKAANNGDRLSQVWAVRGNLG